MLATTTSRAQSSTKAHAQPSATRACLDAIPDSALAMEVVYLIPKVRDAHHGVRPFILSSIDLLTEAIAQHMRLPHDSATLARDGVPDSLTWRGLEGEVFLTVRRDGTFSARAVPDSVDDGIAKGYRGLSLILNATEAVARAGEPFPWDAEQEDDSLTVALSLWNLEHDRDGTIRKMSARVAFPVFFVRAPWSDEVKELTGVGQLRYPDEARRRGYEAEVPMRFTVDTAGRAIASSIHESIPDDRVSPRGENEVMYAQFVSAVQRAIPTFRFQPRIMAGCAVPATVVQPFTFSLVR